METVQWPQQGVERRVKPQREKTLNCPRCHSTNTKFCYYNNYSLSQPRYFCKSCRRYWTEGGTLRNVPVGGSSRKKKRFNSSSSSSLPSSTLKAVASAASSAPLVSSTLRNLQPSKLIPHELSYFSLSSAVSALEPIRSGISSRRLISVEAPNSSREAELSANGRIKLRTLAPSHSLYWQTMGIEELMWPSMMNVSCEYGIGSMEERKEGGDGKLALHFEDLKQVTIRNACDEVVKGGVDPNLFWEGIMGNNGGW